METAKIRIKTYKGKLSRKYYKIAYYRRKFYFVHISKEKISECKECVGKNGKKYLEYTGQFSIDDKVIRI